MKSVLLATSFTDEESRPAQSGLGPTVKSLQCKQPLPLHLVGFGQKGATGGF